MSTTTTKTRKPDSYADARRILLGGTVNPTLTDAQVAEIVEKHDEAARKGDEKGRWTWRELLLDKRHAGETWEVVDEDGDIMHEMPEGTIVALLQDLRDELRGIRRALEKRA